MIEIILFIIGRFAVAQLLNINQNHSFNAQVVENGFLKQISSYIDEGLLISTQEDETGIVFIHTAYASTYI